MTITDRVLEISNAVVQRLEGATACGCHCADHGVSVIATVAMVHGQPEVWTNVETEIEDVVDVLNTAQRALSQGGHKPLLVSAASSA